jgi:SAM-dependent methyltransferase
MPDLEKVADHYTHGGLLGAIEAGLTALGKATGAVSIEDLAAVDEFHIGGRQASLEFLEQLGLSAKDRVIDVGCGLGGAARLVAQRYGSRVSGIDLTEEYVATGRTLCAWTGLAERVDLQQGSALETSFADGSFDAGYMLHVGMNIAEKPALYREIRRVLSLGARFGVYDVMRCDAGELAFPVPWATTPAESAVAGVEDYLGALEDAGFRIIAQRNRRDFALAFFAQLRARAASGPPPLGLHILLGATAGAKIQNMVANIANGLIAPVEVIAEAV